MVTSTTDSPLWHGRVRTLTKRAIVLITLALLPIGLISALQSVQALHTARETYRDALSSQTESAAAPQARMIVEMAGQARALAHAVPALIDRPADCLDTMDRIASSASGITFAGFINAGQVSVCNNYNRRFEFAGIPPSDRLFETRTAHVSFNPAGEASGASVVIVSEPVTGSDGAFLGFVSLSFPATPLADARRFAQVDNRVRLLTFNAQGEVLGSEIGPSDLPALLPPSTTLRDVAAGDNRVFTTQSEDGQLRDFALVPILDDKAYALGIWKRPTLLAASVSALWHTAAFPLLMWLASLAVAVLALRREVIKPINALRMRMRSFADSRALFPNPALATAPTELRDIGETFEDMADQIVRDEAALETQLRERDLLLREVHHRVRNNIQLIASILNMETRSAEHDAARAVLSRVNRRLETISTYHEDLYAASTLSDLRMDDLLRKLIDRLMRDADPEDGPLDMRVNLAKLKLEPEQSGPLAMLASEGIANAAHYVGKTSDGACFVQITLTSARVGTEETVELRIVNTLAPDQELSAAGLGTRLIEAYARQLNGTLRIEQHDSQYDLHVTFARQTAQTGT